MSVADKLCKNKEAVQGFYVFRMCVIFAFICFTCLVFANVRKIAKIGCEKLVNKTVPCLRYLPLEPSWNGVIRFQTKHALIPVLGIKSVIMPKLICH